ncbi:catechol 2,3-dioxygenase-like lactoylglutathione lyase family enzyme [Actinoplanes tereljensis]|uniref:VOC domain-containing protein n=1 Tax=Paractinoplanes tereljensis TaxID=571912 RepID=A0A919NPZ5_9ACTN|nr:VOC family protein [Actinoplanes tereljensis]GIF22198.1 hypothetical protein Ate02nite_49280 [Actinoplanes tereljensis]
MDLDVVAVVAIVVQLFVCWTAGLAMLAHALERGWFGGSGGGLTPLVVGTGVLLLPGGPVVAALPAVLRGWTTTAWTLALLGPAIAVVLGLWWLLSKLTESARGVQPWPPPGVRVAPPGPPPWFAGALPITFVPSTDLPRSRRFYAAVLGLHPSRTESYSAGESPAVWVTAGSAAIRITDVGADLRPQPFTVLGWQVDDLRAEIHTLVARGVTFIRLDGMDQDDDGVWTAPDGSGVAWFRDPDGNMLSLTGQRPRAA